jgi:hypothetical protein
LKSALEFDGRDSQRIAADVIGAHGFGKCLQNISGVLAENGLRNIRYIK